VTGFDVGAYVPRVLLARTPEAPRHWRTEGTLIFVDISGFTKLSDQLARRGREGAEDLVSTLVRIFTVLLSASDDGGDLIKFGGDALLVSYTGPGHERRACHAAYMMQRVMRVIGNVQLTGARARLRMSIGVHSDVFDYLLPGTGHQDLVVVGPGVTRVLELEGVAEAGEILVSPTTARALPSSCLGAVKGPGRPANPTASGQAEFGMNLKKATATGSVTGKMRFTYDIAPLDHGCATATCLAFDTTSLTSLTFNTDGTIATLRANGSLTGTTTAYSIVVVALDGSPDRIRIRLFKGTNVNTRTLVYDNQMAAGNDETVAPTTVDDGGSIQVKKAP